MTDLTPTPAFDNVVQLETTDQALAGPGQTMNQQAQSLLNRTEFLKKKLDDLETPSATTGTAGIGHLSVLPVPTSGPLRAYLNTGDSRRIREDATIFDYMTPAQQADALLPSPTLIHTAQVQAAFAELGSTSTQLKINIGATFVLDDSVVMSSISGFRVYGRGLLKQTAANKIILHMSGCSNFEIEQVRHYGLGTDFVPLADTSLGVGIYAQECNDFDIHHCKFTNFGYAGVQTRDGSDFGLDDLTVIGTHGITSSISPGDIYQFAVICKSNWPSLIGPKHFSIDNIVARNIAMGVRVEPMARSYSVDNFDIEDVRGNHGVYLNGQDFSVLGAMGKRIEIDGIKLQSFWNASGPTTDPIKNVAVAEFVIDDVGTGVILDKTHTTALQNENVSITDGVVSNADNTGIGIHVVDCKALKIDGNNTKGGAYGILANTFTSGQGVSGAITNNTTIDSQWAGIFGFTDEILDISGNTVIRPCLAAAAGTPQESAIYSSGTTSAKRIRLDGNTVFVDTSTGVVNGISALSVAVALGANDLDGKAYNLAGSTIRKRSNAGDIVGLNTWGSSPNIANNSSATVSFTATGAVGSDIVAYVSHASDLQGCQISADIEADTIKVTISNNTGGAKTIADGFVRWGIMKFGA